MNSLDTELKANFETFRGDWTKQVQENWEALEGQALYMESYRRLASLNALKNDIVVPNFSSDSAAFFFEAHNDALVSHVAASCGSWRSALQSLRSCIENTFAALYYKDHPIELELWRSGSARLSFTELFQYLEKHPKLISLTPDETGLAFAKQEYGTLSRAVHASAINFRMTDGGAAVLLWNTDHAKAGAWATRESRVIEALVLVMAFMFREKLSGAQLPGLRSMMPYAISSSKRKVLREKAGIKI